MLERAGEGTREGDTLFSHYNDLPVLSCIPLVSLLAFFCCSTVDE